MRVEKIYFNTQDGVELFGLLHTSEEKNDTDVVISTHGMGSNCFKKRDDIIAQKLTDNNISYFTYNNRGQGLINPVSLGKEKILQGTVFEDVENSYFDLIAAIKILQQRGYKNIHLQGHSLGATKTVYTFNKLVEKNEVDILDSVKSVILLSLVDISEVMSFLIKSNNKADIIKIALDKESEGDLNYVINTGVAFLPMVSVRTFLRYYRDNENIDFARYTDEGFEFEKLNNIKVPVFMRWGNVNELVSLPVDAVVRVVDGKIDNVCKDIGYIDGAGHNYSGKAEVLAEEIFAFLKRF